MVIKLQLISVRLNTSETEYRRQITSTLSRQENDTCEPIDHVPVMCLVASKHRNIRTRNHRRGAQEGAILDRSKHFTLQADVYRAWRLSMQNNIGIAEEKRHVLGVWQFRDDGLLLRGS